MPAPFSVKAYVDDHAIYAPAKTAKQAYALAVEWHVVKKLPDVTISDGINDYSIAEFSSVIGEMERGRLSKTLNWTRDEDRRLFDPSTDLPDDTPTEAVRLPTRIMNALSAAGVRTLGEIREASDAKLLSFQDLGSGSVKWLRDRLK